MKLDLKDKKILYELDLNSRATLNEISKKVGLSKQVVDYRVTKTRLLEAIVIAIPGPHSLRSPGHFREVGALRSSHIGESSKIRDF
ncbi:winged helix-turn-helix transcriptional regulator [Candidatus Woesearchaeota archaeon]|nr:winged helix-turn-helix transcriptional regulator [Candidatus Woesearchaeota archaeon]HLC80671.1 winged helix-turn-helix transcriptional regulator [Candidatus Nanoarchaeia archaeon]